AMQQLGEKDHDAVVLRFFEGRNFKEVGVALGASEDAAKMRVSRALEKLRRFFKKRGVILPVAALMTAISAHSVQAAPTTLGGAISTVAIKGSAATASTLALVKGTLKVMAWVKTKILIMIGAGTVLAGAAVLTLHQQEEQNRQQENVIRTQEQQIRAQEQSADLSPGLKKRLDEKLHQLQTNQNELRVKQDQLLEQDPNPFTHPSQQVSPFTKVRFEGDKVLVTYLGDELELAAVNGITTADVLAFCRQQYKPGMIEKRLIQDLPVVLSDMKHPANADNTVSLVLLNPTTRQSIAIEHAAMTIENRRAIMLTQVTNEPASTGN
ncbi:MAG TPA: sigma factor-like helix-turn-helix DNA-binding protein, partial [Verrucomicrobiae bacterium]|nr:sigma factor-like helix-turn-helix DNA-binding protein [Verrucomicrobiae bacterium]